MDRGPVHDLDPPLAIAAWLAAEHASIGLISMRTFAKAGMMAGTMAGREVWALWCRSASDEAIKYRLAQRS